MRPAGIGALVAMCWLAWPTNGGTDTGAYTGASGSLLPYQVDAVRMAGEKVRFVEGYADQPCDSSACGMAWTVTASYTLESVSDEPLALLIGFPLTFGSSEVEQPYDAFGEHFAVKVDGRPVAYRPEIHGCDAEGRYPYDAVYLFKVEFAPRRAVQVELSYEDWVTTEGGDSSYIDFILNTGALWNGPIGSVEMEWIFRWPTKDVGLRWTEPGRELRWAEEDTRPMCGFEYDHCDVLLPLGGDTVRLWSTRSRFQYRMTCEDGTMVLRLSGRNIEPAGNISIVYWTTVYHLESELTGIELPCSFEGFANWRTRYYNESSAGEETPPETPEGTGEEGGP